MSWSPENSVVTNLGTYLLTNARLGKGRVKLTKVYARENFESSMSTIRAYTAADITAASIAQEGYILSTRSTPYPDPEEDIETSLVNIRFSNEDLESESDTYNLRQIVIMGRLVDIDSDDNPPPAEDIGEVPYMVCQCDSSAECDVMPARSVNPTSFDYNVYVIHSGVEEISVSVRTDGFVYQADFDTFKQETEDYETELDAFLDQMFDDLRAEDAGTSVKNKSLTTWYPQYGWNSENERTWTKTESSAVTAGDGAEKFNFHNLTSQNIPTGVNSASFGTETEALKDNSFSTGKQNYVNGENSFASGKNNAIQNGYNNAIFGDTNVIEGGNANIVSGKDNIVGAYTSPVSYTATFGDGLINKTYGSLVVGSYNAEEAQTAFVVGDGEDNDNRHNLLVLYKSGKLKVPTLQAASLLNEEGEPYTFDVDLDYMKEGTGQNAIVANDLNNNTSSARFSTTFGEKNSVSGNDSIVGGKECNAESTQTLVMGSKSLATGTSNYSALFGEKSKAENSSHTLISGSNNSINRSNQSVIVGGTDNYIYTDNSTNPTKDNNFVGSSSYTEMWNSEMCTALSSSAQFKNCAGAVAIGTAFNAMFERVQLSLVSGMSHDKLTDIKSSIISGDGHVVEDILNTFVSGYSSVISHVENSFAIGTALIQEGTSSTKIKNQTVLGKYNNNDPQKLFIIGNGTDSDNRHNAITIDSSGNIFANEGETSLNAQIAANTTALESKADLVNGKVPTSQLPSYVSGTVEGYYYNGAFYSDSEHTQTLTPSSEIIYVDLDSNNTYRWSGSVYVEISASLTLGETAETAYRGDRGKAAYDHASDSSKSTTAAQSGLYKIATTSEGHIASYTAVTKSDITDLGIPAQDTTYVFEGTYNASTNKAATMSDIKDGVLSTYSAASSKANITTSSTVEEAVEQLDFRTQNNESNISKVTPVTLSKRHKPQSADYEIVSDLTISIPAGKKYLIHATAMFNNVAPKGVIINKTNAIATNKNTVFSEIDGGETDYGGLTASAIMSNTGSSAFDICIFAKYKSANASGSDVIVSYQDITENS